MSTRKRVQYLIDYCLKNYYINQANQVENGEFVHKWQHEYEMKNGSLDKVRELQNEIERLAILWEPNKPIPPSMLSEHIRFRDKLSNSQGQLRRKMFQLERRLILDALKQNADNKSQAAQILGISRQTIITKLKQYSKC